MSVPIVADTVRKYIWQIILKSPRIAELLGEEEATKWLGEFHKVLYGQLFIEQFDNIIAKVQTTREIDEYILKCSDFIIEEIVKKGTANEIIINLFKNK